MRPLLSILAVLLSCLPGASAPAAQQRFALVSADGIASIVVPAGEAECVRLAAEDLARDTQRITGKAPMIETTDKAGTSVVLVSVNRPESAALLERLAPGFGDALKGKWEAYRVEVVGPRLIIAGSDERGTMFGLYEFIEKHLGVAPLHFWATRPPATRPTLSWDEVRLSGGEPTFRFRGWFINDEDLLTEWKESGGKRNIDYPYYSQVVNREVMRSIAEALVRSRCNLIIPASFIDILNPPEEALVQECARRGVFVSQHHVEPMGVSAFSYFNYWKKQGKNLKYSYFSHPQEVREVWRVYAEKWAAYPNVIWQLGLRGIADRPMWMADDKTPQSDEDRGKLISDAMAEQVKILDKVLPGKPRLMSTTLWAEGAVLNQKGLLRVPEKTIIVFADNSPGWKWQADFHSTKRDPRNSYGVYYHHGLIGAGPHLAQIVPPYKTHECLKAALDSGAASYAIFNVGNIREFVLGIDASAKMTWRMDGFDPDAFLYTWVKQRFSRKPAEFANAYRIYFNAWQIHPEQQVPFLMDGQMFGAGNSSLGELSKKIKEKKIGAGAAAEPGRPPTWQENHSPKSTDAFYAGLSDMHPRTLGRRESLKRLAAQKAGLAMALMHARAAAPALAEPEATFLHDNLIYPAAIMVQTCTWLEEVLLAHESLDLGDLASCAAHLEAAEAAFARLPELAEGYCHGQWKDWYRGCKKLNIAATLKRTRDVRAQVVAARKQEPRL